VSARGAILTTGLTGIGLACVGAALSNEDIQINAGADW